ncbi:MAG TPA: glutamine synthetase beta-grasp domain-containing protein, partial [Thermomicrobiales bacterium]|nr:glutamine synthetase beta-grasp domain-containing protein [Thermomicrobiales bacterium]
MAVETRPAATPDRSDAVTDALERVQRDGIRIVDLQFSDIAGGARSMTVPAALLPAILAHGYRFDGSAVTGGLREVELDLYLQPDPTTMTIFERADNGARRAQFACSVRRRDGQPFAGDPR